MTQYRITSDSFLSSMPQEDDCILPEDDIIHDLKRLAGLGGLGKPSLKEYKPSYGEEMSNTGTKLSQIQKERNIRPGDPEWFRLWFSQPLLTKVQPY